jgi:hypothetical protein
MKILAPSVLKFVSEVALPATDSGYESLDSAPPPPPTFTGDRQALTVGSELAEFSAAVPVELRSPISNSLLLAHLAADKAASQAQDVVEWYNQFRNALTQLGWQTADFEMKEQTISDENASMNKAIIPAIMAMLGPQAAAASIVLAVLNGLKEMDSNTPWITLFEKASQHVSGAKFQVSYVDADPGAQPESRITTACVAISATNTITQVLFFKFSSKNAVLKTGSASLSQSSDLLAASKDAIAKRVAAYVASNVMNIQI